MNRLPGVSEVCRLSQSDFGEVRVAVEKCFLSCLPPIKDLVDADLCRAEIFVA